MKTRGYITKTLPAKKADLLKHLHDFPDIGDLMKAHKEVYGSGQGGAIIPNTRVLHGYGAEYLEETKACHADLVERFVNTGMNPRLYGTCFLVDDPDDELAHADQAAIRLGAAIALAYQLAFPYIYFDAFELFDRVQTRQMVRIPEGIDDLPNRVSIHDLLEVAGVVHIQAHAGLSPYAQSTVHGVVSRCINKGVFVVLEYAAGVPAVANEHRMSKFLMDVAAPAPIPTKRERLR